MKNDAIYTCHPEECNDEESLGMEYHLDLM